jgi:photosystem II stability/assembly factor-like uncharacterized protein
LNTARNLTLLVSLSLLATGAAAQTVDPVLFSGLEWRQVGPYRGGRSLAVAGSTARPKEFYFGATGGGVWKTTDGGANWAPVSDGFVSTSSVGALAVAPSNPDIVVAGTGERDIRGNISHGDGVYRTTDGGKTWSHIGLKETQTIARIVIHPTNPDTMLVAALGHIYGRGLARGVYKTTDGGKTWRQVLPGSDRAGAVNVVMDPQNPNVLLASTWDAWRTPYTMNSGGPGSRLFRSTDGGETWTDISRNTGLPSGTLGKIGMAISPVDPKRYWAIVEAAEGGLFRSDDAGATWERVNDSRAWRQRAWYYSHVYADPKNRDAVYVLNVNFGKSTDGGKTFTTLRAPHSDHHDLWIAPDDPNRMINANDGGGTVSTDGGKTWTAQDFPTAQMYHVVTDNAFPYRILGAQQDNSTVRIPSRTQGPGITSNDWTATAGGESGYIAPKPNDPDIVYGGSYGGDLSMLNHRTNEFRSVDPWPDNPMGHGAIDLVHRFQWTYPIVFSPHDPNVLYTSSQYVLKTTNGGQSWKRISPDLTRNDPSTLGPSGGPITKDNTSVEYYGTVFTLAESPKRRGVLWAGSDDGLIHVSENGGQTWRNVTPAGMPKWGLVSMIEASPHDPGTAYAAVDNHENDDLAPYAYRTTDYGRTWTKIVTGLPTDSFVRVVREDRRRKGLLYAGTETGVWVSFDNGGNWQSLRQNLPNTPVHDLAWKEDDLIAATHGRSFWVLDDLTPLHQLAASPKTTGPRFFTPKDAYRVTWGLGRAPKAGANPRSGVVLSYYLPEDAKELKFEFKDAQGKVFQTLTTAPKKKGFNRTSANLQYPSYKGFPGMVMWGAFPGPIKAPPGAYTVTMSADGFRQGASFRWLKDPRSSSSDRDLTEQFRFLQRIAGRVDEANSAVTRIRNVRSALDKATDEAGKKGDVASLTPVAQKLRADLTRVEEALYQTQNRSGQDPLNYPIRLNNRLAALITIVSNGDFRPTDQSYEVFNGLSKELDVQLAALSRLLGTDLAAVNAELQKRGVAPVSPNAEPPKAATPAGQTEPPMGEG